MKRNSTYWAITFCVVLTALAGINYYVFVTLKEDIVDREELQLRRIVDTTASALDNIFVVTAAVLDRVRDAYERGQQPREMYGIVRVTVEALPFLRAISITDARGIVQHSSRGFPAPYIDLSATEAVRYFRAGGKDELFISGPSRNVVDNRWQIQIAVPVRDEIGRTVTNVITAVVDPQYIFTQLFALGQHDADRIVLIDGQFRVVALHPWRNDTIGTSMAEAQLFARLASSRDDKTSGIVRSYLVGDERVGAALWLSDRRFALGITRSLDEALGSWRISGTVIAAASGALVLFLGLAWLSSARAERRQSRQAAALELTNAALLAETNRAEHLATVKSDFLANMSHEIRTPLNGIIGYAGLAAEESDPALIRQYVGRVLDAGRTLRVIIDEILDFSTVEAGGVRLDPAPFSIARVVDHCLAIGGPAAAAKGLALELRIVGKLPDWVLGDKLRIGQVLQNFLNNATKFTERGTVTLEVTCTPAAGHLDVRFAVHDTGIGISPDGQARLFRRFSQADSSIWRRFGGTGLGLAIAQRIVEAMGGKIGVDSKLGVGSTFWCSLPLPPASAPGPDETVSGDAVAAVAPLRVLVVDDHEMNRELVAAILRKAGHAVDMAEDGPAAVCKAREQPYDLVLTDIQMPGMDGLETARQIRALGDRQARLPIVAMTANVLPEQVALYLAAGLTDHIGKPIDRQWLLAGLARWTMGDAVTPPAVPMAPSEPPPALNVHDPATWNELQDMLGVDRVRDFAGNLRSLLSGREWAYEPGDDTTALARSAHACVSLAGQLGFADLSAASRRLETACVNQSGIEAARDEFDLARLQALIALDRLLAGSPEHGRADDGREAVTPA